MNYKFQISNTTENCLKCYFFHSGKHYPPVQVPEMEQTKANREQVKAGSDRKRDRYWDRGETGKLFQKPNRWRVRHGAGSDRGAGA